MYVMMGMSPPKSLVRHCDRLVLTSLSQRNVVFERNFGTTHEGSNCDQSPLLYCELTPLLYDQLFKCIRFERFIGRTIVLQAMSRISLYKRVVTVKCMVALHKLVNLTMIIITIIIVILLMKLCISEYNYTQRCIKIY